MFVFYQTLLFIRFIRIMFMQAGIQKENLLIAYEPEVAALHCVSMPASQVTLRTRDNIASMFKPGCSFLVLDLGGNHKYSFVFLSIF